MAQEIDFKYAVRGSRESSTGPHLLSTDDQKLAPAFLSHLLELKTEQSLVIKTIEATLVN
jgi:hypothetical protein